MEQGGRRAECVDNGKWASGYWVDLVLVRLEPDAMRELKKLFRRDGRRMSFLGQVSVACTVVDCIWAAKLPDRRAGLLGPLY